MRMGLMLATLLVTGCTVDEQTLVDRWDTFVAENNSCAVDTDCAVVYPGCPLGCYDAVSTDAVDEAEAEADRILRIYRRPGRGCDYDCTQNDPPTCEAGTCQVTSSE